ncbi:hypothetical protein RDI58_017979 [Solanum bulbocastanum]|uniref:Uncharacterized protein n=1 Tax=Solanum bulbocastanum TaxID=147425 RepID=A0AAN8Y9B8_SOLBU
MFIYSLPILFVLRRILLYCNITLAFCSSIKVVLLTWYQSLYDLGKQSKSFRCRRVAPIYAARLANDYVCKSWVTVNQSMLLGLLVEDLVAVTCLFGLVFDLFGLV